MEAEDDKKFLASDLVNCQCHQDALNLRPLSLAAILDPPSSIL